MHRKKETRPADQSNERVQKSNHILTQEAVGGALVIGLTVFAVLVVPHIMYDFIAPLKGWC